MKIIQLLFFFAISFNHIIAQATTNISGDWVGFRFQNNASKTTYQESFKYKYSLSQKDSKIIGVVRIKRTGSGTSTDYAEIAIRGHISGGKLYFQEYEILNAKRSNGFLWCLKTGILDIDTLSNNQVILRGKTRSVSETTKVECTGGYSYLVRNNNSSNEGVMDSSSFLDTTEYIYSIQAYPNPFNSQVAISFNLPSTKKIHLDIVDINGNIVAVLVNQTDLSSGTHSYNFTPSGVYTNTLFFYVRLRIADKTYTRILQKT